ncbi:MAG: 50S ribosomal protein L23 [Candidatus Paceibacteria bacterium]
MTAFRIFHKKEPRKEIKEKSANEGIVPEPPKTLTSKSSIGLELLIERPQITEKSGHLQAENKYVFIVNKKAKKPQIKSAIEAIYGVKVENVRIVNVPGKVKRLGRSEGFKPGYKKAIVALKEGQKIELG